MFYVYLLCSINSDDIYIGFTTNLERRLSEHNAGKNVSTKKHQWRMAYYEAYASESDARDRETKLKQYGKSLAMLKKRLSESLKNLKGAG